MIWEIKEFLRDSFKVIIVIAIVFFLILYVFSITQVVGSSMSPTLHENDILILNKLKYRIGKIKRGDIVSLDYKDSKYLIKRIIGLPGEYIEIRDNKVYINGTLYEEKYIDSSLVYDDFELSSLGYEKIPENMYFVLGDNRSNSLDSRDKSVGLIPKENIHGKISFRFWPITKPKFY